MEKEAMKTLLTTPNQKWDNQIAFSIKDLSEMLHVPKSTISDIIHQNKIPYFKIGRHYRIRRTALCTYLYEAEDKTIPI